MEMLSPDAEGDAAAGSVKSEDSTPPHEGGRGSPPPNCAICLGTCRNKCFTDSCLHQFCFKCLLTWSKVKAECPLCKQNFKSIIHNVRSNHQYEEYMVEQRVETIPDPAVDLSNATRRFRYRTTLTLPRRDTLALQHLLMHYPMMAGVLPPAPAPGPPPRRRRRSPNSFRRTVYRHNLWARPLPDFTGRYRDCSPEFYRRNDSQIHRLVPWLSRELHYLLNENAGHISYVLARLLELLPQYHITSAEFANAVQRYFGDRTEHFLHELHCFASTPYDMAGYDRQVQYTTDTRISTVVNEISSTESDSGDSDIVMVSSSAPHPTEPPPGPSRPPPPSIVPIETVSHSGTDDDEEVVVVGYIKPPADRTPEVVDLVGSDSDVVVQETAPEPEANLVKLSLTRRRVSDSDSSYVAEPEERPKRKRRGSVSATDSERLTPSPPLPPPTLEPRPEPNANTSSSDPDPSSSSDCEDRRRRNPKRMRRKSRKDKKRSKKSPKRRRASERPKHKSHHGHGVKCSRRPEEPEPGPSTSTSRATRLRSVVNVPAKSSDSSSSGHSNLLNLLSSAILNPHSNVLAYNSDSGSVPENRHGPETEQLIQKAQSCFKAQSSGSDPEDDLPLNLSVQRSQPL